MKSRCETILVCVFACVTVILAGFLFYTVYVWTGTGVLLQNLDENFSVDSVEVYPSIDYTTVNATITVSNTFLGSYMRLYIVLWALNVNGTEVLLSDRAGNQVPGTVAGILVYPLSSGTVGMYFNVSSNSVTIQTPRNLMFIFRVTARTIVTENRAHYPIDIYKLYQ